MGAERYTLHISKVLSLIPTKTGTNFLTYTFPILPTLFIAFGLHVLIIYCILWLKYSDTVVFSHSVYIMTSLIGDVLKCNVLIPYSFV